MSGNVPVLKCEALILMFLQSLHLGTKINDIQQ